MPDNNAEFNMYIDESTHVRGGHGYIKKSVFPSIYRNIETFYNYKLLNSTWFKGAHDAGNRINIGEKQLRLALSTIIGRILTFHKIYVK